MSKTLPQLSAAGALDGSELMLVGQGGNPRQTTAQEVANLPHQVPFELNIMDFIPSTEWAAITSYTFPAPYDSYTAILAAIAALPAGTYEYGGIIRFPPGYFGVSDTIQLKKCVHLVGAGGLDRVTILAWPNNKTGIVVNDFDTNNNAIESPATTTAGGSKFQGISFEGNGAAKELDGITLANTSGHGIHMRARATIEDCQFSSWAEDGIHIDASVGGDDATRGNANNWAIIHSVCGNNGSNGLFIYGSDVNAGTCVGLSAGSNGKWGANNPGVVDDGHGNIYGGTNGWGINDISFLGNTFVGCHTEFNASGPYTVTNANARSVFLGCYSEQDGSGGSLILAPSMVIGGIHAAGFQSGCTGNINLGGDISGRGLSIGLKAGNGTQTMTTALGEGALGQLSVNGAPTDFWHYGRWDDASGCFVDQYGLGNNPVNGGNSAIMRTTALTTTEDYDNSPTKLPAGYMIFPQQYWVNLGGGFAKLVVVTYASAAPTQGTWAVGNIVYNTAPAAGGYVGWICTTAGSGSPTTAVFKTFGPISA